MSVRSETLLVNLESKNWRAAMEDYWLGSVSNDCAFVARRDRRFLDQRVGNRRSEKQYFDCRSTRAVDKMTVIILQNIHFLSDKDIDREVVCGSDTWCK